MITQSETNAFYRLRAATMLDLITADIGLGTDAARTAIGAASGFSAKVDAAMNDATPDVIIERQNDIYAAIDNAVANATNGVCLAISAARGSHVDPADCKSQVWDVSMILKLYVQPIRLSQDDRTEEDIFEGVLVRLHHRRFTTADEGAIHHVNFDDQKLMCVDWDDVPNPNYLQRNLTVRSQISF